MSTATKHTRSSWITVDQFCEELQISRYTFYDWRKKGCAPRCTKLPNGSLRIRRTDVEKYMTGLEETV